MSTKRSQVELTGVAGVGTFIGVLAVLIAVFHLTGCVPKVAANPRCLSVKLGNSQVRVCSDPVRGDGSAVTVCGVSAQATTAGPTWRQEQQR